MNWDWEETIKYIMSVTGKTRRQAEAELRDKLASGELHATGINPKTGVREQVPIGAFPRIH